jgi:hypothetical protein
MRRINVLALLCCGCVHAPAPAKPATIDDASQAAFNSDYAKARNLYLSVARTTADAKEREDAEIGLAKIEWRIDGNSDAARLRLDALGASRSLLEQSRLERELGRYSESEALARRAMALAQDKGERNAAGLALVEAIVESHLSARRARRAPPAADLREAFDLVRRIVEQGRGHVRPSLLYLDAALMLGDGEAALDAWKSYFDGAAASALLAPAATRLEQLLRHWNGGASPELAKALADSRLFDEAVLVGASPHVVAWDDYIRRAQELTNDYYREVANHRGNPGAYREELTKLTLGICRTLNVECGEKTIEGKLETPLFDRFGALIAAGDTSGTFNLHFGHAVVDEKRQVSQYGRGGAMRLIVLDTMVSNGFESWSWNGAAQHGGWAGESFIVQVRPAYAEKPVREWERFADPEQRKKRDEEIARETEKDWSRAAADPHCYLPGLQMRMRRAAVLGLLDELRAKGLTDAALREAFISELGRRETESSIFAHEGRHAIDAQSRPKWWAWLVDSPSQSEFQAKLSEIAFAPDPKLAMAGGIIAANIGSDSKHGEANSRIMKGAVEWMKSHQVEIAGLDAKRPLLPQLDRLTDEQLRALARSMDPMAK